MNDLDSTDNNSSQSEELTREQRAILALSTMAAEDKVFAEKLYYAMNSIYAVNILLVEALDARDE